MRRVRGIVKRARDEPEEEYDVIGLRTSACILKKLQPREDTANPVTGTTIPHLCPRVDINTGRVFLFY